jgi:hypothetical protein
LIRALPTAARAFEAPSVAIQRLPRRSTAMLSGAPSLLIWLGSLKPPK